MGEGLTDRSKQLKQFALRLSKLVKEFMASTIYLPNPLRASDLSESKAIQNHYEEHGFGTLNHALHAIVKANLEAFVPELSYERTKHNINWFFKPVKFPSPTKRKTVAPKCSLRVKLDEEFPLYFSEEEKETLKRYGKKFEELVNDGLEPATKAQARFKQVALSLLEHSHELRDIKPDDYYQKLMAKYIICRHYKLEPSGS